jgi:hypothetical protein
MFVTTQMPSLSLGFPDVCAIPTPVGPIPIPFPNIAESVMALPPTTAMNILIDCMPVHNMGTTGTLSEGDAGIGVLSGMMMGPHRTLVGSFTCLMGGLPTSRMLSMTGQNGICMNCPGVTLSPSQVTVLCLMP